MERSAKVDSVLDLIGRTPMVRLNRLPKPGSAAIFAKMESLNPGGSVKDRIALAMVEDAERRGVLRPGGTIVEATSGNTGIGLAMVAAVKGYRLVLTMPDDMSVERQRLLARFGAELILTPAIEGMTGAVFAAEDLLTKHPDYFMPRSFRTRPTLRFTAARPPRRFSQPPTGSSTPSWPAWGPAEPSPAWGRCFARSFRGF